MRFLENLVLGTPYLFLKKIPYAWIPAVALWTWPPIVSGAFAAIIVLGLAMMALQEHFWEAKISRACNGHGKVYRAQPHMPLKIRMRNAALVLAGSAILALIMQNRFYLTGGQWFVLAAGFILLYRDHVIFGKTAVYLVTSQGIGVRYVPGHVDYRPFFNYGEMDCIMQVSNASELPARYDLLSPLQDGKRGVLLKAKQGNGFSSQFRHILLTPPDVEEFLAHVPATLVEKPSAASR
jgi:hypothetical protein